MKTTVNGKMGDGTVPWTPEVQAEWEKRVAPLFQEGEWCSDANYYTPRPYVDEYNRATTYYGFIYVVQPGNRVCFESWQ